MMQNDVLIKKNKIVINRHTIFINDLSLISQTSHNILNSPFFCFNDPATTEIYTLSLHDALPILTPEPQPHVVRRPWVARDPRHHAGHVLGLPRSEEHTSELQSPCNLVCRLLLEKKKKIKNYLFFNKKK